MEAIQKYIKDVCGVLGKEKVSADMPTRIAYRITHGPEALLHENLDDFTPAVVVRPKSTEDVQGIVKLANEYEIPIVPQGGRTSSYGAEGLRGCIAVDTASMNKILELDEGTYRMTAEAGVRMIDVIDYLAKRNYMSLDFPTLLRASTLGSRVAVAGYNKFENRWGSSAVNTKGLEVVLPSGDVVQLGRGTRKPVKAALGYDLLSLFIGSRGSLGIITKVTQRFIDTPPAYVYGIMGFKDFREGIEAFLDLKKPINSSTIWRIKGYHKWMLKQATESLLGITWPEDVEMLVDYHILGLPEVVKAVEAYALNICKQHKGFWRSDMPDASFVGRMHETIEKYMGMAAIQSDRTKNGGMGNRLILLDPMIPDKTLSKFYGECLELLKRIEDGKNYSALTSKLKVLESATPVSGEDGWSFFYIGLLATWKDWSKETRKAFKDWFREFAELVWRNDGALTCTHGFMPREMEVEFIKREIGEKEYEFMRTIKRAIDPKNIFNPKIRF